MSGPKSKPPADLAALKKRLAEKEAEARAKAAPKPAPGRRPGGAPGTPRGGAAPPPPPPEEPARPVSFDDEMERLGVRPDTAGTDRIAARPAAGGGPVRPARAEPEPEPLDDDEAWERSVKGVVERREGVQRGPAGRIPSLPTLDLHGMAEEDARHELARFVKLHRGPEPRWIRVITGRGRHGSGVLRTAVVRWLDGLPSVASFRRAPPEEGGDGVLLVQLRRTARP